MHTYYVISNFPTKYRDELVACKGANVARYAIALSEIYPHALFWIQYSQKLGRGERERHIIETANTNASNVIGSVLHAPDSVWEDNPGFTIESYAYLVIAELKLICHALTFLEQGVNLPKTVPTDHMAIVVSAGPVVVQFNPGPTLLSDLQRRSSRALGRVALLIQHSLGVPGDILTESFTLVIRDILSAVMELVTHAHLYSGSEMDQKLYTYDEAIVIRVATSQHIGYSTIPRIISNEERMRSGVLGSVIAVLGPHAKHLLGSTHRREIERLSLNIVAKIGPVFMKQWAAVCGQTDWTTFHRLSTLAQLAELDAPVPEAVLVEPTISQLLEIANFSMLFLGCPDMYQLAEVALESLSYKSDTEDGRRILHDKLVGGLYLILCWVQALEWYGAKQESAKDQRINSVWMGLHIASLLAIQGSEGSTVCRALLEYLTPIQGHGRTHIITIMGMIGTPQLSHAYAEKLFSSIIGHIERSMAIPELLEVFTKKDGLKCLLRMKESNPHLAGKCIIDILMCLDRSRNWVEQDVLYELLQAICLACEFPPEKWAHLSNFFIPCAIRHLKNLQTPLIRSAGANTIHTIELALGRLKTEAQHMTHERSRTLANLNYLTNAVRQGISSSEGINPQEFRGTAPAWAAARVAWGQPHPGPASSVVP